MSEIAIAALLTRVNEVSVSALSVPLDGSPNVKTLPLVPILKKIKVGF